MNAESAARQMWMAILARAPAEDLRRLAVPFLPAYKPLRGPEIGLIMLQARAGGSGQPFNLGEATVARCTIRTEAGTVGHAYRLGRDLHAAELAAALDAALQDPTHHDLIQTEIIEPLGQAQAEARALTARRAAATQVQFSTMATMRGE